MRLAPQHPVLPVQGHRGLVSFGQLYRRGDMVGVAVGADDREDLAVTHHAEHARRVGAWIDDDDLLVVTDDPDVDLAGSRAAVGRRGRQEVIDPSGHPGASFLVCLTRRPFLPQLP